MTSADITPVKGWLATTKTRSSQGLGNSSKSKIEFPISAISEQTYSTTLMSSIIHPSRKSKEESLLKTKRTKMLSSIPRGTTQKKPKSISDCTYVGAAPENA